VDSCWRKERRGTLTCACLGYVEVEASDGEVAVLDLRLLHHSHGFVPSHATSRRLYKTAVRRCCATKST
jgi:hypothetical protein